MKKLVFDIPIVTRSILIISIIFYIINVIFFINNVNISKYVGLYQFSNENFNIFQILTFSFSHDVKITHLLYNCLYFILIGAECERILKRKFLWLILITIIINAIGIQLLSNVSNNFAGLSTIVYASFAAFIILKNQLNVSLSFSLKMFCFLFVFNECIHVTEFGNIDFYLYVPHLIGIASGFIISMVFKVRT
jgi:membrane associated rhomboid family serine protease